MSHAHSPGDHHHDIAAMITKEFWDERYGSAGAIWSGNPNPRLIEQAADLAPGSVLDVGCGEGADAIWLASRGWQVTGIDISTVALERAAQRAAEVAPEIAERIIWRQVDLLTWRPATTDQFDLVSAQFMHLPRPELRSVHRLLAAVVRPGGTLLIVGHHPSDLETTMARPNAPEIMYTAEEIAADLDPADWDVIVADAPSREVVDPEGRPVTIRDAVMKAVRRGVPR